MGTFLSLLGIAGSLLMTWLGMEKQEEAYGKESAKEEERYKTRLEMTKEDRAISKKELAYQKKERAKEWKWKEEERNYDRGQSLISGFTSLLEKDPASKNNLLNVWGRQGKSMNIQAPNYKQGFARMGGIISQGVTTLGSAIDSDIQKKKEREA